MAQPVGEVGLRGLQLGRLDTFEIGTLKLSNVPTLFLVDEDGRILETVEGFQRAKMEELAARFSAQTRRTATNSAGTSLGTSGMERR